MPVTPRLSICVPSRNRQAELIVTLDALAKSQREDIEIVIADNSDDPAIMNDHMASRPPDPRVVYLPTDAVIHSMRDNWERTYLRTRGDFIAMIGDDDYIEPDVVDFINRIVAHDPEIESIAWQRLSYNWPEVRTRRSGTFVSLVNEIHKMPKATMVKRMFRWEMASHVPACPFTIYHGAVSRGLMERIRKNFCGRYFEHPIVDYDNAFKILFSAKGLAYIDRPMSVMGVCAKSNSSAIGRYERTVEINKAFIAENGDGYENNEYLRDFPFGTKQGVAPAILAAQIWFKRKYNVTVDGWEENFAKACNIESGLSVTRSGFDAHCQLLRQGFEAFEGGKYLPLFQPAWREMEGQELYFGLMKRQLLIEEGIGATETPRDFYEIVKQIIAPPEATEFRFEAQSQPKLQVRESS